MSKKINRLTTPFADGGIAEMPWNIYPRPQLKRDSFICLNGEWDFAMTKEDRPPREFNEKICVPFPPESELSGIGRTPGKYDFMHYRRTFTLPEGFMRDKVLLRFGAVDRLATVSVNGEVVGTHNNGYLPFYADITALIREGENTIDVKVKDNLSKLFPYGKQKRKRGGMWYTPVSGIWQTVWLESVPENYIQRLIITPTVNDVKIKVVGGAGKKVLTLTESGKVFKFDGDEITLSPKNPECWTPENPRLYYFAIETETDKIESYFALREVGICDTGGVLRLTLNKKPYLFNGLLDQGYFPDGLFLPATPDGYENDILTAKKLGFNMLRKHIKIEPPIFYHLCDKLGIAVFQDMVNNSKYSFLRDTALPTLGLKKRSDKNAHKNPISRKAFENCMRGTANTLYNYPSVVYYTVFNEGWGQFCADEMYGKLKEEDKTRIIDATSGWFFRTESDVDSHHVYFKKLKCTPESRPLVVSEFGGYSCRINGHLFSDKNYGYSTYKTREEYEDAVCALYTEQVLPLVRMGASAFVYTQVSDVEDETNGLLTYDRRVLKVDADRMADIAAKLYAAADNVGKEDVE